MQPRFTQKVKNLSVGCPCLRSACLWGQGSVLEFSNKHCRKHSWEHLLGVLWCFWSCLLVNGWLCVFKQDRLNSLRSVELFTSRKSNLLKLTAVTCTGSICQYRQSEPYISEPVACFWLLQCDGVWALGWSSSALARLLRCSHSSGGSQAL